MARDAVSAGNYNSAVSFYLKALSALEDIDSKEGGEICIQLAIVYQRAEQTIQARRYAGLALEIVRGTPLEKSAIALYEELGGTVSDLPEPVTVQTNQLRYRKRLKTMLRKR